MDKLRELCKELRILNLEELVKEVEFNNPEQYLTDILQLAVNQRRSRRVKRLIKLAGFPVAKTLDNYDFNPINFPKSIDKTDLLSLDLTKEKTF